MDGLLPLTLKSSRLAFYVYLMAAGIAMCSVLLSGLNLLLKGFLILLSMLFVFARRRTIPVLIACTNQRWWMQEQPGAEKIPLELYGEVLVLAWLVVMRCRRGDNGKTFALALWPDSADSEDLRRLRVFLRYGKMHSLS